jgi:hypothetical protein
MLLRSYERNGYAAVAYHSSITITPLLRKTATTITQQYLTDFCNPDVVVREIEEYTLNCHVQVYEKSTGIGALEQLIDKYTGPIYPEMGPNIM